MIIIESPTVRITNEIDYKSLLKRYIVHITENEGIHFLDDGYINYNKETPGFTKSEVLEMRKLFDEYIEETKS